MIIKTQPGLQYHIWRAATRNDDGKNCQDVEQIDMYDIIKHGDSAEYGYFICEGRFGLLGIRKKKQRRSDGHKQV